MRTPSAWVTISHSSRAVGLLGLVLLGLVVWGGYSLGERRAIDSMRGAGEHRLELYANGLAAELARYDYLPIVLALNKDLVALLGTPDNAALTDSVNGYLAQVNAEAKTSALYVLDLHGTVLAASNWNAPVSFVGMDLSYRPYFQDALKGGRGRFYGIGTTSGEPGYYFSYGIYRHGEMLGVAAVKVSLDSVEQTWSPGPERVLVTDPDGVILLSSEPTWKFRALSALSPQTLARLAATRQYFGASLQPIDLAIEQELGERVRVLRLREDGAGSGRRFLANSRSMPDTNWSISVLWDLAPARVSARAAAVSAGLAYAFLFVLALYVHQRRRAVRQRLAAKEALQRAHDELELKVAERTADLRSANEQLQREIAERRRTEQVLREAQDELVHASKMAVLGQLSASMTHEINQPLAAMRALSDNAQVLIDRDRLPEARRNLEKISNLVERMGQITSQLKSFARKSPVRRVPVPVQRAVANALFLLEQRLRNEQITLDLDMPPADVLALCDANRLEQVLVNLLGNAIDAMKGCAQRRLSLSVRHTESGVRISVRDSGTGIAPEILPRLFEPFCTTKEPGLGLGLGLAISAGIVNDLGGSLGASNLDGGGAEFVIELQEATAEPTPETSHD